MDGIVLLRSDTVEHLEELINLAPYKSILQKTDTSFVGLYNRTL